MVKATAITFISEPPHGVFEAYTPIERTVMAEVKSVGMKEFYMALNDGIQPEFVFTLTDYIDYQGEKIFRFDGVIYDVVRTFVKGQTIDITAKRREVNQS